MSDKAVSVSGFDYFKLLSSALIMVGAISAFYLYAEYSLLVRVLGLLAAVGVAVFVALQSLQGQVIWQYLSDARTEVRKVVWPTRQETVQTTLVVIVMVILIGIFLWLVDMLLMWGVQLLTGQGG
jgi:preprotein translocase subunit SecE